MLSSFLKNISMLKKFLFINLIVFVLFGSLTAIYLKGIQPNLINKKTSNHIKIINNTHKEFVYVVNKKKQFIGILTDADVRRAILKKIDLKNSIKKIYNKNPKFVYQTDDLKKVDKTFKQNRVNFLPVVNKNKKVIDFIEVHEHREKMNSQILNKKDSDCAKTLIIMAGGKGLRLRPLTKNTPKPLIKITNKKSILEYNIDHFLGQGIEKIYILTHYLSHKIDEKIIINSISSWKLTPITISPS